MKTPRKIHKGTVKSVDNVGYDVFKLVFSSETPVDISPGQYVSILCESLTLRRPFSVSGFHNGLIEVLFKLKGKGTKYLSNLKAGDTVDFLAPLGNGFTIENKKSLLIGAGVGVAPLFYLASKINTEVFFASGFKTKNEIIDYDYDFISTDDGTEGQKGSICNYLDEIIEKFKPEKIYSCAPNIVLKYVIKAGKKYGIETEVAFEKVMACGIGVCRGCVIELNRDGEKINATVCTDGPVFKGEEVVC